MFFGNLNFNLSNKKLYPKKQHTHLDQYSHVIDEFEHMIRSQLVAAIGKEVGPSDFHEFLQWHSDLLETKRATIFYIFNRLANHPLNVSSRALGFHALSATTG